VGERDAVEIRELFLSSDLPPGGPIHIAFRAGSRAAVDRFYDAALAAGGRDNGKPGERPYHPGYYSAYVLDPDS
jgi:catechol 2,3-dioxygenase-like lactoylglutathione lyase family enzyme